MSNLWDKSYNVLKCRDDHEPAFLYTEVKDGANVLKLRDDCSWAKKGEEVKPQKIRKQIEPWLTALFQSEHLSLLTGSGLSQAVHILATGKPMQGMDNPQFTTLNTQIQDSAKYVANIAGRSEGNFEDRIRVANELLTGLDHLYRFVTEENGTKQKNKETVESLRRELKDILKSFADAILSAESAIVSAKSFEKSMTVLISFLMSFASRSGTRDRLQVFTTNYDRLIEAGSELAGLHLVDRFVGSLMPIFRASRLNLDMHYNPPGIRGEPRYLEGVVKYTKLHGSLDWIQSRDEIRRLGLPFGAASIEPFLEAIGDEKTTAHDIMIYPNSAKDRETAMYPYVELFRDFASAVCRPNSTVVTYGYGFGDEHVNRILRDMLTIPSTHLVVISYNDPLDRIQHYFENWGRKHQMTLLVGAHLGDLQSLVEHYLPKPAIDRTTLRMADLLRSRFGTEVQKHKEEAQGNEGEQDEHDSPEF